MVTFAKLSVVAMIMTPEVLFQLEVGTIQESNDEADEELHVSTGEGVTVMLEPEVALRMRHW